MAEVLPPLFRCSFCMLSVIFKEADACFLDAMHRRIRALGRGNNCKWLSVLGPLCPAQAAQAQRPRVSLAKVFFPAMWRAATLSLGMLDRAMVVVIQIVMPGWQGTPCRCTAHMLRCDMNFLQSNWLSSQQKDHGASIQRTSSKLSRLVNPLLRRKGMQSACCQRHTLHNRTVAQRSESFRHGLLMG